MDPLRVGRVDFINTFPLAWSLAQRHDGAIDEVLGVPTELNALLAAGAKPDLATRYKIVPLTLAAQNGNAAAIDRLLKAGAKPDAISEDNQTVLMTAARNGRPDAVRALLRAGAKVNVAESFKGQTEANALARVRPVVEAMERRIGAAQTLLE